MIPDMERRFKHIDRIIESANVYLQTDAWQADYLCREAQTIIEIIRDKMTTGDIAKYDETKIRAENARNTPPQYLDAAKHLWGFTVDIYRCIRRRTPPPTPSPSPQPVNPPARPQPPSQPQAQQFAPWVLQQPLVHMPYYPRHAHAYCPFVAPVYCQFIPTVPHYYCPGKCSVVKPCWGRCKLFSGTTRKGKRQ